MLNILGFVSIETFILLGVFLLLFRLYIHKKWQVLKDLNIPHDPPSILGLGNIAELISNPDAIFSNDLINKKKFGKVYGKYNFWIPEVIISDPEILKQIFIKEFSTFSKRSNVFLKINGKQLNDNLNVVFGSQWKRIRKTLSTSFSSSKLKSMFHIVDECADAMMVRFSNISQQNKGRFETKETFGRASLDMICSAAFSTKVQSQVGKDGQPPKIVQFAQKAFDFSVAGRPWFMLLIMFPWIEDILAMFNYSILPTDTVNYFSSLLNALRHRSKPKELQKTDLMQLMLRAEISDEEAKSGAIKGLTQSEILANSVIMMLVGYDTTANAMCFLAYNLATHKNIQEKVRREIVDNIEKHGGLTYDAISKMDYLTMCINETLRLYGVTPRNTRACDKDITINGVRILKGMQVVVPVYGLSHDEEYWDEPFQFKPERMEDMSKIDPMVFQPFGAGPRSCIGMRFALMEIKVAFCKLLQKFDLDVCVDTPKPPLAMTVMAFMKPKEVIHLKISPRSKNDPNI